MRGQLTAQFLSERLGLNLFDSRPSQDVTTDSPWVLGQIQHRRQRMQQIEIGAFASFNIAIMVLAAGKLLHRRLRLLRTFNIPEPVASGLLVILLAATVVCIAIQSLTGPLTSAPGRECPAGPGPA